VFSIADLTEETAQSEELIAVARNLKWLYIMRIWWSMMCGGSNDPALH